MPTFLMRQISWIKAALKVFNDFPPSVRGEMIEALDLVADGVFPKIAKPLKGLETGVYELALPFSGNAWRVVYALKIDDRVWVIHAFQKKSTQGIKTQKHDIDLIEARISFLRRI